jgi:hypothetical protein
VWTRTRLLFTVGWAGLLLASVLVEPVWTRANPLRWALPTGGQDDRLTGFGLWPAVGALLLFTVAEQVIADRPGAVRATGSPAFRRRPARPRSWAC